MRDPRESQSAPADGERSAETMGLRLASAGQVDTESNGAGSKGPQPNDRPSAVDGHSSKLDPRMLAAWREWLAALATDAEAAIAASHVYSELPPEARDAWLDAVAEDAQRIAVPPIAIYTPLLAAESDPARCKRIERAIGEIPFSASALSSTIALRGIREGGSRLVTLIAPLYLRFVRVLRCRYNPDAGFAWAKHDLLIRAEDAPRDGDTLDGVRLEVTPLKLVIEELAHAILAERRRGGNLPACLHLFADLFNAQIEEEPLP